jgi:hypothetical protein
MTMIIGLHKAGAMDLAFRFLDERCVRVVSQLFTLRVHWFMAFSENGTERKHDYFLKKLRKKNRNLIK